MSQSTDRKMQDCNQSHRYCASEKIPVFVNYRKQMQHPLKDNCITKGLKKKSLNHLLLLKTYGFSCNPQKQLADANSRGMGVVSEGEAASSWGNKV